MASVRRTLPELQQGTVDDCSELHHHNSSLGYWGPLCLPVWSWYSFQNEHWSYVAKKHVVLSPSLFLKQHASRFAWKCRILTCSLLGNGCCRCRTHCIGLHRTGLYLVQILFALHFTVDWALTTSALHQNNVTTESSTQTAHHLKVCLSMTTSRCPWASPPTFVPAWPLGITLE